LEHDAPACSSLRFPAVPVNSTKGNPKSFSEVIGTAGANDTDTETLGEFATEDEIETDEPVIDEANIAGNDPVELTATKLFEESKIPDSTELLSANAFAETLKVPKEKVSTESLIMLAPKRNSNSMEPATAGDLMPKNDMMFEFA
jgi:hypothetical protein